MLPRRLLAFPAALTSARLVLLLLGYAVGFVLLHRLAAYWGNASSFSLWFPPAGLRFAVLWILGPSAGLLVAATELAAQALTGVYRGTMWWITAIGTAYTSLSYAVGIALVRRCLRSGVGSLATPPMPMGVAMLLCPLIAVSGSLPWALFVGPQSGQAVNWERIMGEAGTFWIGDLLGILMVAPPLLWLVARKFSLPRVQIFARHWEAITVTAAGWLITGLFWLSTSSIRVEPMLLCAIWVALRLGRMAAWIVSSMVACAVLLSAGISMPLDERAQLHLLAASLAIASYLVGSYAEAEKGMRQNLQRQERLLLQADRLKTLRAMSVAAIHDISQPLSTLSIEARYARELADSEVVDKQELAETSALIERKTSHLAELVRRMRLFGSDRADQLEPVRVSHLLSEVVALVRTEAASAGTLLEVDKGECGHIMGREVELQQALVNLVRNAIAAAPGGSVTLSAIDDGDAVRVQVRDNGNASNSGRGMGLGLIIARTIAEAHGGKLQSEAMDAGGSRYALVLPRGGEA